MEFFSNLRDFHIRCKNHLGKTLLSKAFQQYQACVWHANTLRDLGPTYKTNMHPPISKTCFHNLIPKLVAIIVVIEPIHTKIYIHQSKTMFIHQNPRISPNLYDIVKSYFQLNNNKVEISHKFVRSYLLCHFSTRCLDLTIINLNAEWPTFQLEHVES